MEGKGWGFGPTTMACRISALVLLSTRLTLVGAAMASFLDPEKPSEDDEAADDEFVGF
jgi:hypothetical protein